MDTRTLVCGIALGLAAFTGATRAQPASPATEKYAWAQTCQACHDSIYEAWSKTKHATAFGRLSGAEQEKPCVGCHVTGAKTPILDGKRVVNAGIQCESCHGAAAAHAADPTVTAGLTKVPPASVCEDCHNDKSPHFKGFWYDAMRPLSHRVK
jgi:hypothetical protein